MGSIMAKELLLELPHRQFVFTQDAGASSNHRLRPAIPKILRPYFSNRQSDCSGLVSKAHLFAVNPSISVSLPVKQLQSGCVVSFQSFGEFARLTPIGTSLSSKEVSAEYDKFVYLPPDAWESSKWSARPAHRSRPGVCKSLASCSAIVAARSGENTPRTGGHAELLEAFRI
jgi:hypothetical protein